MQLQEPQDKVLRFRIRLNGQSIKLQQSFFNQAWWCVCVCVCICFLACSPMCARAVNSHRWKSRTTRRAWGIWVMEKLFVSQIELRPKGNTVALLETTWVHAWTTTHRRRGKHSIRLHSADATPIYSSLYIPINTVFSLLSPARHST